MTINEYFDNGVYRLPNQLSHQCFDFEEFRETLGQILAGELGAAGGDEREALIDEYLAARDGPLACERIVDVLEKTAANLPNLPTPPIGDRLQGWFRANKRRVRRWFKLRKKDSTRSLEHQQNKYPEVPLGEVRARVARLLKVLGDDDRLNVEQIHRKLFRISR